MPDIPPQIPLAGQVSEDKYAAEQLRRRQEEIEEVKRRAAAESRRKSYQTEQES